jgi:(p)ppGpp synthase/HD superfamily hydrolase
MHRLAELAAAHWDYKLGSKSDPSLTVKQVSQSKPASFFHPQGQDESPDSELPITGGKEAVPVGPRDALVTAKRDIMQQTVYVFLAGGTEGKLISLPTNSLVRDDHCARRPN